MDYDGGHSVITGALKSRRISSRYSRRKGKRNTKDREVREILSVKRIQLTFAGSKM